MKKISIFLNFIVIFTFNLFSQAHFSEQAHQEAVSTIIPATQPNSFESEYFSIGKDGFLIKWTSDNQGEHYQITDLESELAKE